jgi:hypothetical protein
LSGTAGGGVDETVLQVSVPEEALVGLRDYEDQPQNEGEGKAGRNAPCPTTAFHSAPAAATSL